MGYSLDVDGEFGVKTQAAVKDYQKKNKLVVDGIVGEKTWGSLNSSGKSTKSSTLKTASKTSAKFKTTANKPKYTKSAELKKTEKTLSDYEKNKPKEYSSAYKKQIDEALNAILNRKPFSYDVNADPLYRQYREMYMKNGEKAMLDTVGAVSALTGGYGSSYAVSAGNESYADYLNKLNSLLPELRESAYKAYENEGDTLSETLSLLRSLDDSDYKKYRDSVSDYSDTRDYLLKKLNEMSDSEYKKFTDELKSWQNDRDFSYKQYLQDFAEKKYKEEMEYKKEQAALKQANADRNYNLALLKLYSSGSKSSSGSGSKSGTKSSTKSNTTVKKYDYPRTYEAFVKETGFSGIFTKNEFTARESAKKKYKSYDYYLKAMYKKYG